MTRRALFLLPAAASGERIPVDDMRINAFANAWNAYITKLQAGVIDRQLWLKRVIPAWERLA